MKNILFILLCLSYSIMISGQDKATLLYIGDPMCSWCYGFSSELDEAVAELSEVTDFELIMGGLRPYNKETMVELKPFLTDHWNEVHERTGQKFSHDILEEKDMLYDTEPACRAVVTMKNLHPEFSYSFFKSIQHAFYFQNKNPNSTETYVEIALKLGVDGETFLEKFESIEMEDAVRTDFNISAEIGATSFPTIILKKDDTYFLITRGYSKSEVIVKNVLKVLSGEY